jgi:hypothetical protein
VARFLQSGKIRLRASPKKLSFFALTLSRVTGKTCEQFSTNCEITGGRMRRADFIKQKITDENETKQPQKHGRKKRRKKIQGTAIAG